jgi:hypothetical protein
MQTAMQDLIEHLEILKCRLDMVDVDSIIEYATFSLQNEKEQIADAFRNGSTSSMLGGGHWTQYYNQKYNQH